MTDRQVQRVVLKWIEDLAIAIGETTGKLDRKLRDASEENAKVSEGLHARMRDLEARFLRELAEQRHSACRERGEGQPCSGLLSDEALIKVISGLDATIQTMTAPKEIIRDATGKVVGIKPKAGILRRADG